MRNGPHKHLEWPWLDEEIARLEDLARQHNGHNSQAWRTRYDDLVCWMNENPDLLTTRQRSKARARLGRLTWSKSG